MKNPSHSWSVKVSGTGALVGGEIMTWSLLMTFVQHIGTGSAMIVFLVGGDDNDIYSHVNILIALLFCILALVI